MVDSVSEGRGTLAWEVLLDFQSLLLPTELEGLFDVVNLVLFVS
jgi:hypothetical protein